MLSLLSSPTALVVGPATGATTLASASFTNRLAPPSSVKGSYKPGIRLQEAAEAEAAPAVAGPLAPDFWESNPKVNVQGNSLRTWDIGAQTTERVQLGLRSSGRPIDSNIELWHTPAYIPAKFHAYTEDGNLRPIDAVIETPKHPKTVAVYNTQPLEFPFDGVVAKTGLGKAYDSLAGEHHEMVQGGKITSFVFGPEVESIQILLKTGRSEVGDRNMKAKIELIEGPNQVKQFFEIYCSSGYKNPFFATIKTPTSNPTTVRIINQNTVEFPFDAYVLPYEMAGDDASTPVMGGGSPF